MCKNGKCEHSPTIERQLTQERTTEEIRYARLWAEIEPPKALNTRDEMIEK